MNDFERFLPHFQAIEPPPGLFLRVMSRVHVARLRRLWLGLVTIGTAFVSACVLTALSWQAISAEVMSSTFVGYLRLMLSDPDIVLTNLKDFASGLLESLPLQSILIALLFAVLLVGMATLVQSLRREQRHSLLHRV